MKTLFHITKRSQLNRFISESFYVAENFETEKFIHAARPHQLNDVINKHFKDSTEELLLLIIDQEKVTAEVKYEDIELENNVKDKYPHIHGKLNKSAIIDTLPLNKIYNNFVLPKEISISNDTLIRLAYLGDEAEIANVHVNAWRESYAGIIPDSYLNNQPLSFKNRMIMWRNTIKTQTPTTVFVAESKDSGIVAFCSVCPPRDKEEEFKELGEISAIYSLKQFKNKGIGRELFTMGLNHLKNQNCKRAYLWVLKDNPTVEFYKKAGGEVSNITKKTQLGKELEEVVMFFDV